MQIHVLFRFALFGMLLALNNYSDEVNIYIYGGFTMKEKHNMNYQAHLLEIVLVLVVILTMSFGNALARDEVSENLQLVGIIMSVDIRSHSVVVDVKTEGCLGERTFNYDRVDADSFRSNKVGTKIEFFIESSECSDRAVYKINSPERR